MYWSDLRGIGRFLEVMVALHYYCAESCMAWPRALLVFGPGIIPGSHVWVPGIINIALCT